MWYFSIRVQKSLQAGEDERDQSYAKALRSLVCQLLSFVDEVSGEKGSRKCTLTCVSAQNGVEGTRLNKVILVINYYFQGKSWLNYLL